MVFSILFSVVYAEEPWSLLKYVSFTVRDNSWSEFLNIWKHFRFQGFTSQKVSEFLVIDYIESSQLMCTANQLSGYYMMKTLVGITLTKAGSTLFQTRNVYCSVVSYDQYA